MGLRPKPRGGFAARTLRRAPAGVWGRSPQQRFCGEAAPVFGGEPQPPRPPWPPSFYGPVHKWHNSISGTIRQGSWACHLLRFLLYCMYILWPYPFYIEVCLTVLLHWEHELRDFFAMLNIFLPIVPFQSTRGQTGTYALRVVTTVCREGSGNSVPRIQRHSTGPATKIIAKVLQISKKHRNYTEIQQILFSFKFIFSP